MCVLVTRALVRLDATHAWSHTFNDTRCLARASLADAVGRRGIEGTGKKQKKHGNLPAKNFKWGKHRPGERGEREGSTR